MKKAFRLRTAAVVLAVMTLVMSFAAITASASSASEAKNSIVAVVSQDGMYYGTGFAIGEVGKPVEYIVTNNHVVGGSEGNTMATVYFSLASNKMMLANVYYYNEEKDIAVLRLPEPTEERQAMVLCPMKHVDIDDTFAALGYPANQATDWIKYNTDDITVTKGGIKKADRINGMDVYMLDLDVTFGNSGGPLVNSAGEVVGINTFGINDESYAVAIDELLDIINTDKIPVTVHNNNAIILIVIAAVVLAAIIALVIVLVVRKKKDNDSPSYQEIIDPAQPPVKKAAARIIAVGGTLNGRRYSLNGVVRIGRDASKCGIAFPVSTQGVSAVHCEVGFDGTVCYVKDLSSSYGTFTMAGQKLAPNAPCVLKSGDKFYLAGPENTFEVRF